MATGGVPEKKEVDFRYTCTLCMEPYQGRTPKILPCFHCFCLPCLSALEASVHTAMTEAQPADEGKQAEAGQNTEAGTSSDDVIPADDVKQRAHSGVTEGNGGVADQGRGRATGEDEGQDRVFLCPSCRASVSIPEGGVENLQTNFYVDHETDGEQAPPPCNMCEEETPQPATHACQQCQLNMCRTCRRHHDMIARDHHVTAVSLGQPVRKKENMMCWIHRDQVLCFYCRQCQTSLCLHCKCSSHEGHDTVPLSQEVVQAKKDMVSLLNTAENQIQVVQTSMRQVEDQERQLALDAQKVTQQINSHTDQLISFVHQSRDQLLEEVTRKAGSSQGQLQMKKLTMSAIVNTLSSLVSHTVRGADNDPDVVLLRNDLKSALLSEDKLDRFHQSDSEASPWPWRYDTVVADAHVQAGGLQACIGTLINSSSTHTSHPASLPQLMARLDSVMKTVDDTSTRFLTCEHEMAVLKLKEADIEKKMLAVDNDFSTLKKADIEKKFSTLGNDVAALKTGLAATQQTTVSLTNDVTKLKKDGDDQTKKVTTINDDVTTLKIEQSVLQLRTTSPEKDVTDMKTAMQALKDNIGHKVLFHARNMDKTKTELIKPAVFRDVEINEGGGYDGNTGIFTCPVPGVYLFSATVGSASKENNVGADIYVDNMDYATLRGSYTTGCATVCVQLKAKQRVWIKRWSDVEKYCIGETSFMGLLVQPQV